MSTVQEITAAIPGLSRRELEELRAWFDEFWEDQLELTDEVKAKLDAARDDIREGRYRVGRRTRPDRTALRRPSSRDLQEIRSQPPTV